MRKGTALKHVEGGRQVKDVCRELGISDAICHVWKSKYGGMEAAGGKTEKVSGTIPGWPSH